LKGVDCNLLIMNGLCKAGWVVDKGEREDCGVQDCGEVVEGG
jgi:hypothetical protein